MNIPQSQAASVPRSIESRRILFIVLVSVAILAPALIYGIPSSTDLGNHFRFALPFYDALRSGHLYPGWLAESNAGYGDTSFRFYPPALYYLLALTRTLTGNWYSGTLLAFTFLSVVAALGCYLWARLILPASAAMWAAVFYTLIPYHINQFYQASLLAEYAGSAILPFTFLFVERVCRQRRRRDIAGLAISYGLLVLTHLPLTVIASLAILLYALLRIPKANRWTTLARLAASAGLGLAASSCYWLTMLAEKSLIRADRVQPDPSVYYARNFIFSTFSPENLNVWWVNILTGLTFLMLLPALALCFPSVRKAIGSAALGSVALVFTFAMVMSTQLSLPIWKMLVPLQDIEFPWRWLAITSLAGCLLVGAVCPYWINLIHGRKRPLVLLAFAGVFISIAFSLAHTVREAKFLSSSNFATRLQSIPGSNSVKVWLPIWASDHPREMKEKVEIAERSVKIDSWAAERRTFQVGPGNPSTARIKTFYYPHWTATADGRRLSTSAADDGALLISLPPQAVAVTLEFREPLRVRIAEVVTACGWLTIMALLIPMRARKPRLSSE